MTHLEVGPIVSLAYVLTIGDWQPIAHGKQVTSYLGLIPEEDSRADKRRHEAGQPSTAGGTPPSKTRRRTAPSASARNRTRWFTNSSVAAQSRRRSMS